MTKFCPADAGSNTTARDGTAQVLLLDHSGQKLGFLLRSTPDRYCGLGSCLGQSVSAAPPEWNYRRREFRNPKKIMTLSEKMQQSSDIGRATALLETMNQRLSCGTRGWAMKQLDDWRALRELCNRQIARAELLAPRVQATSDGDEPGLKLA